VIHDCRQCFVSKLACFDGDAVGRLGEDAMRYRPDDRSRGYLRAGYLLNPGLSRILPGSLPCPDGPHEKKLTRSRSSRL
jgi:hypothetical protein